MQRIVISMLPATLFIRYQIDRSNEIAELLFTGALNTNMPLMSRTIYEYKCLYIYTHFCRAK